MILPIFASPGASNVTIPKLKETKDIKYALLFTTESEATDLTTIIK